MTRDELITELQLASGRDSSAQDTQIPGYGDVAELAESVDDESGHNA